MNRRNRAGCSLLVLATVAAHFAPQNMGVLPWVLLVLQCIVYPQLVYFRALYASDQRRAEMQNLLLDGVCFGAWAAALGFPIWITFIFLVTITVNMTVFRGRIGFPQALASMLAGALPMGAINGWHFSPDTNLAVTLLSVLSIMFYVLVVAENAYARALKLQETKGQLQLREQELERQLQENTLLQSKLRDQAYRDALTGLYNRRYFDATLERELARCSREDLPLSVAMIDIDWFKRINDDHGHQAGDEVLKLLAALLDAQVRASDVVCRYGGEEFVLLLPGVTAATAHERAEQLRADFASSRAPYGELQVGSTLSVGIASFPEHGGTAAELIRCADLAMYKAKTSGRNCVVIADEAIQYGRAGGNAA
ncbi:sensor domain-containing diguanylate cyclase [Lacisediminimonas sp.]|uniref:sensor domain-containing diguanylate cyclase n=1 Tax=Lacisediminimonas sp. TaxID=3060582 RepID=UPI00272A044E|nr:sensor domain-containing diguanylate cyclase [Lacisediminimonas sp.]